MWKPKSKNIFADYSPYYVENIGIRKVVKSFVVKDAIEGYIYAIRTIYRNHSVVNEQLEGYRIRLSDGVEEQFYWYDIDFGNVSGVKEVIFPAEDSDTPTISPTIIAVFDYDQIPDGGFVGGGGCRMVIDPQNYIYASWFIDDRPIFGDYFPFFAEGADIRKAIKSITIKDAVEGYVYYIKEIYRNHATVHEHIMGYRIKLSDLSEEQFWWYSPELGDVSGITSIIYKAEVSDSPLISPTIIAVIDYGEIPDGGVVTGGKMIIDPSNYLYKGLEVATAINIITFKRTGISGVDADFCGLNAIGDALASITDASEFNRYELRGSGEFLFSSPSDLIYQDVYGEWTAVVGKDWIDIKGASREKLIIAVELADNLAIDYGTYQPVMWNCNSRLSNATIIAKNCRYGVHFEGGSLVTDKTLYFDNLIIWHKGNYNYAWTSQSGSTAWQGTNAIGAGIRDGQTFDIDNCLLWSEQTFPFACHSAMSAVDNGAWIYLRNVEFKSTGLGLFGYNPFPNGKMVKLFLINPIISCVPWISCGSLYWTIEDVTADSCELDVISDHLPLAYSNIGLIGGGLRIVSKSTGITSTVIFDHTCTAFDYIIGISTGTILRKLDGIPIFNMVMSGEMAVLVHLVMQ